MLDFLIWYLLVTLIGLLAFPVAFRLLPYLHDRGYALSRPLGLLLWGFAFWLLTSLHILQNDLGGVLFALVLLAGVSAWALRGGIGQEILTWLRTQSKVVLVGEGLFLLAFAAWAFVRANVPDITGTEKPMEIAFINAILRSPAFPPLDPWLSGYSISYYYFGYVLIAMLIRITGTASAVGFNLTVALWFALTALAGYGILYSLIRTLKQRKAASRVQLKPGSSPWWALLAPLYILIVSNIEGFLEILHARGIFWGQAADGSWQSAFWSWLQIKELDVPPSLPFSFTPDRAGILWWRGSRVIQDYGALNQPWEVIDEFPNFSYLLGDLHPHVLAMPFVLLAIGLALNLYLQGQHESFWGRTLRRWVSRWEFWAAAVVFGGLAFLNTWDFPIYVALFSAVYTLVRYQQEGWGRERLWDFLKTAVVLGIAGAVLYLPFYLGFSSQAGGLLPSMVFMTRGVNFWVMFASLLFPIFLWLVIAWREEGTRSGLLSGLKVAAGIVAALWVLMLLLGFLAVALPAVGNAIVSAPGGENSRLGQNLMQWGDLFLNQQGAGSADVFRIAFQRRVTDPGTWLTLFALILLVWGLIAGTHKPVRPALLGDENFAEGPHEVRETGFVLLLILLGAGLTLFPEFFYLRDQFGTRMNTIFKFYFQTWILWGLAAAYATYYIWSVMSVRIPQAGRIAVRIGWSVVFLMAMVYPVLMVLNRTNSFQNQTVTLNGIAYMQTFNPDQAQAIQWLQQAPLGVLAEAVGGSYTDFARISAYTGLPTVLGWPGHESQWRGGAAEIGSREADIGLLYRTASWADAYNILMRYNIRYVVLGNMERSTYRVSEAKFSQYLKVAYQNNSVTIYEVPDLRLLQVPLPPP